MRGSVGVQSTIISNVNDYTRGSVGVQSTIISTVMIT